MPKAAPAKERACADETCLNMSAMPANVNRYETMPTVPVMMRHAKVASGMSLQPRHSMEWQMANGITMANAMDAHQSQQSKLDAETSERTAANETPARPRERPEAQD